ncbi:disulfide bond formation protein DsbA [Actinomadura sp. KC345]|uniref:mycothiol-dependent nitroreductase Rv2466c family protein n=1 Tax=Actinomadura sp. KC345 TaxID=2530371 RepID=UPI0010463607|nr:disulfide bond formation protein DsbA [Actinomadura sp. KC345]TDC53517.1 disulfide bond formation protein DsbA [Actinomadura sp. KC345]
MAETVDVWIDPSCPYTWITSRWLLEAAEVRPIDPRWHVLSLSALNEGRDDDPENDPEGYLWMPVRVCAAVVEQGGREALGRFYTAFGTRVHERGEMDTRTIPRALEEAGLSAELAAAAESAEYDDGIRASTAEGIAKVGPHIGTPVVAVGERAFFGPVISRIPRGEEAGRLWDGTLLVSGVPGFHELKGRPHADPDFS